MPNIGDTLPKINVLLALFGAYIVINSDLCIDHVLSRINGSTWVKSPNSYGTVIQACMFLMVFILIDQLGKLDII